MLIIEDNSVYEIDEECVRTKKVPKECRTLEKLQKLRQEREAAGADPRSPAGTDRFPG